MGVEGVMFSTAACLRQKVTHVSNQETFHAVQWSSPGKWAYFGTWGGITYLKQNSQSCGNEYLISHVMVVDRTIITASSRLQSSEKPCDKHHFAEANFRGLG